MTLVASGILQVNLIKTVLQSPDSKVEGQHWRHKEFPVVVILPFHFAW